MRCHIPSLLLFSAAVQATQLRKIKHVEDQSHLLVARQSDGYCSGGTCASCFGPGNIICEDNTCFNPSAGEQCCADGDYCIGPDTSCCGSVGAGSSHDDSATTASNTLPTATDTDSPTTTDSSAGLEASQWTCRASDTPQQCCARAGSDSKWCFGDGDIYTIICYRPGQGEECCADGYTCAGAGCCEEVGETAITPTPTSRSVRASATAIGNDLFTNTATTTNTFDLGGTRTDTTTSSVLLDTSTSSVRSTSSDVTTTSSAASGDGTPVSGGSGSGSGGSNGTPLSGSNSLLSKLSSSVGGVMALLGMIAVL